MTQQETIAAKSEAAAPGTAGRRRLRDWSPTSRQVELACLIALVANTLIVVTGGAVRLTNSGLGCPTWPECTGGSLVPVSTLGYHSVIEFTNRMLTYAVSAGVGLSILAAMFQKPRRPVLVKLSWALFLGVVLQAVIGGITVLTKLAPEWVAVHMCVSMGMIAVSFLLWHRSREGDGPVRLLTRRELLWLGRLLVVATGAVVAVGTLVTGTDPHAGAEDASKRLPFKAMDITQAHADLVFIVVGLTAALWLALKATDAQPRTLGKVRDMFAVLVVQGVLGYTQYFTGLPAWMVLLHMTGACLTWLAAWRVLMSLRERGPAAA
ncbi:COX15/CtaA family protein [Actinospica robiniae]|uniref:COX15/CtaA family protein n=1 Tax=Actinospica robiniae TaxID=304901 RepID=UPI000427EC8C|nr:COX15/CtaA family protein [Actinospica robiniae]